MIRVCSAVLLASALLPVPAVQAQGHWLLLGENEHAEIFIDTVNTVPSPTWVRMWTLLAFKAEQPNGALSEKRLLLYSCKDKRIEWQQSIFYSGSTADGDTIDTKTLPRRSEPAPAGNSAAVPEGQFKAVFNKLC